MFENQLFMFMLVSVFAIVLIILSLRDKRNSRIFKISLSLILGGAIGNLIDRARLGFVIDFLDFRIWPVFNLADSAITIAAILLTWELFFKRDVA